MIEWPVTTLGEICAEGGGFVRTGPFGSQLHQSDYVDDPDGIPVVMPKNMARGRIDCASIARVHADTASRLSHHLLAAGDIALSRRGDVGRSAWIGPEDLPVLCGTGSMRVHPGDARSVHPEYLRYFFQSRLSIDYLEGQAVGATMPNLNAAIVTGLPVPVLPLDLQLSAAEVLRSLDDLIENYGRRTQVLEELSREIYREWFIHFRYPGHENVRLVDSPLGRIPDGWIVSNVGNLASIDKGLSYKGAHLAASGTPMANLKCLRPGGGFRRDGVKPYDGPFKPRHQVAVGDLVMANTDLTQAGAVIGSPALVPRAGFENGGIASHHLFIVRPVKRAARHWLHESFREDRFRSYARGVSSGTTVLGFRPLDLAAYRLPVPPPELVRRFGEVAEGFAQLREELAELKEVSTAQRDLLLPKLVAGQINLSQVDALTEAAIA